MAITHREIKRRDKCPKCGDDGDIVINDRGEELCTDCHFEECCWDYEQSPGPSLPWYHTL